MDPRHEVKAHFIAVGLLNMDCVVCGYLCFWSQILEIL